MDESQNKQTDLKKPKENPKVHTVESQLHKIQENAN